MTRRRPQKAARFYADVQIYLHVELNKDGTDRLYAAQAPYTADRLREVTAEGFSPSPKLLARALRREGGGV